MGLHTASERELFDGRLVTYQRTDSVFSPLSAASATFALNAGECVRRYRLVMSPS